MKIFNIHTTQQNTVRMMKLADHVATTQGKLEIHINAALILYFLIFMLLVGLHHFLICTLPFSVKHHLGACISLCKTLISDGNIIFDIGLFDLCPYFQECN